MNGTILRAVHLALSLAIISLAISALPCLPSAIAQEAATGKLALPVELNAQQDHRRMMGLLGIVSIRRGANGRDPNAPNAANYDEAKATIYPSLPDPLLTQDRRRIDSPEMWRDVRRPEIVELFDREVYGRVPENAPAVAWEVVDMTKGTNGDIPIITKQLVGHVDNSSYPHIMVDIQMNLTTPAQAKGPVPVVMQFSGGFFFRPRPAAGANTTSGNQPSRRPFGRGRFRRGPDWRNMVLQKGWGYAAINTSSIQADNGGGLTKGIVGLVNKGQPRKPDDWGALRAWAWGASRALDYFETDPAVDAKQVGLEGHSRWGKATLVAMAYDPRFAVAYVSSSGAGGASLYRRNYGEIIENVAGSGEYHWMAGNFIKYAGPLTWDDLPVDAHELVALCAPRPVFISSGETGDSWVDAKGMFLAAAHAQPVYELLLAKTMGTDEFPAVETALTDGEIAFRQHSGGHSDGPNWPTFIGFASRYLKAQASPLPPRGDTDDSDEPPQRRTRGGSQRGVYKARITPTWFADGTRFWYRNDLRVGGREYVLVDATKGERKLAFDHQRLAKALSEAGVNNVPADRLALDALEFDTAAGAMSFRSGGKDWRCDLETYELSQIEERKLDGDNDGSGIHPEDAPRASTRTGPETELRFVNQTDSNVELFWLDAGGDRRSYGVLSAGAEQQQHTFAGHVWLAVDASGNAIAAFQAEERPGNALITGRNIARRPSGRRRRPQRSFRSDTSPDGKWRAFVRDGNLFVRDDQAENSEEIQLTQDGTDEISYGRIDWAPDSHALVAFRIDPGEQKEVFLIESSPGGGGRAVLHQRPYALPGDKFTAHELYLFRIAAEESDQNDLEISPTWQTIRLEVEPVDFGRSRVRWNRDGRTFRYTKNDRGHQRLRLIEVDARTGHARNIVDERTDTFIWTAHTENFNIPQVTWLEETNELIYASEVDGWRHLYLIDSTATPADETVTSEPQIASGERRLFAPGLKNQITKGEWVVRGIDRIDEENRQIWFRASGMNGDHDPYLIHYCRVNFDGTGLVQLTEGNGNHSIQFSPDRRYIIDTYSRVDAPPLHELRRVEDGTLMCQLEEADISEVKETGWQPPEVFVAKGRDGTTGIWGIICRPRDFDPNHKYPVIEDIYAGPQGSFVPKSFGSRRRYEVLNDLGFIVVKIDGMGTANRSKAFHDVCWHNLKDAGFPDRIRWMKEAAARYPYMDLSRVGVYGGSAGGQNAAGALLFHPEFYKVAVAGCGCHDNRMDKASWNEQWMGYPVGEQYAECSNIDNAYRLQGKLLLIVGEMDRNVPPESTMRMADALIKADKEFDLLVVPGASHGMGGVYGQRRMHDFFVRHLLAAKRPNRSATEARGTSTGSARRPNGVPRDVRTPSQSNASVEIPSVIVPPESFFEMVREKDRDAARQFYRKYIDVRGMPAVAAGEVADEALQRTYSIVTHMLAGRPDVVQALVDNRMYLIIIGKDQVYTDMPEYRNARNPDYLNERVRGTGGRPTSFGEENLLGWPTDRYDDESIAVHEFCHTIDGALRSLDPVWNERRNAVFRSAMAKGQWKNTYAASNPGEYWAEIAQAYFDCQRINNWNHGPVGTREQLKAYDPDGYEFVRATFNLGPEQDWRYEPPRTLPNVSAPPASLQTDPYYTKFTWAREFTVLGREASDAAMLAANDTIRKMFAYRHDILKALIADGVRLVVLGPDESLADLPEFVGVEQTTGIDLLARTLDYTPDTKLLVVAEENVLGDPKDPLVGHNQVIRAFAKAFYQVAGRRPVDPDWDSRPRGVWQQYELGVQRLDVRFDEKLAELYETATTAGKWRGTAAVHDRVAYWTAGVLAYFDAAGQDAAPHDARHPITTRVDLREYDAGLYAFVRKTMAYDGHVDWRP